jgi:hypothetical protein
MLDHVAMLLSFNNKVQGGRYMVFGISVFP